MATQTIPGLELPQGPERQRSDREADKWIKETIGCLCDPIIVWPGGWGASLPQWLKERITVERLLEPMVAKKEGREIAATDAEACAYLYTLNLSQPVDHDTAQIYLYLGWKCIKAGRGSDFPEDIQVKELNGQQQRELRELKRFIYEARLKARKERERGARWNNQGVQVIDPDDEEPEKVEANQRRMF